MVDIDRVPAASGLTPHVRTVAGDGRGRDQERREDAPRDGGPPPGSEELAVALSEDGRGAMTPRLEQNEQGETVIRIVDSTSGETVAVVTPEELRELAEQTGLPAGMLIETKS
ncbi:MAG: hypothetical protein O2895_05865 [Chloroflexi bacterium]|nr:hypothetical protein [Chloroflexota bacterium]